VHREFGAQSDGGRAAEVRCGESVRRRERGHQAGYGAAGSNCRNARAGHRHFRRRSKSVAEFDGQNFDYVITVCDSAREACPVFFGAAEKLHRSFDDPAALDGSEERMALFRRVRDELRAWLDDFSLNPASAR
jgi:hypothetical protein